MNDKYELAFKVVAKNLKSNKYFLALASAPTSENPVIK